MITSNSTGLPIPVRVTVTEQSESRESRTSYSNSATGKYLVILKPNMSYSLHLESDLIRAFDTVITTQETAQNIKLILDLKAELRERQIASEGVLRPQ